jgi:hypothetical protein
MKLQVFTAEDLDTLQRRADTWFALNPNIIIIRGDFNRSDGWVSYAILYSGEL